MIMQLSTLGMRPKDVITRWGRNVFLCALLFAQLSTNAQTCSINAPTYVCLGDLVSLSFSSSTTATSQSWNFGDGNSSTLSQPFHQYSSPGNYTITLTVQTASGPCTSSRTINVYALPKAYFQVSNTNLCLPNAELCVQDLSTASDPSRPLLKKIILWGDGAADSFSYPGSNYHCYKYLNSANNLPFLMEVVDDKGCKSQDSIKLDVFAGITTFDFYQTVQFGCDSNLLCFCNKSIYDTTLNMQFSWVFNGQTQADPNTEYDNVQASCLKRICFTQKTAGNNNVKLIYSNKFGCRDTLDRNYFYGLFNFTPTLTKDADTLCNKEMVNFVASDAANRNHRWRFENDGASILQNQGNTFSPRVPSPGKWKLRYTVEQNGCVKELFDSVEVRGPSADISAKNTIQCNVNDTVYFVDSSTTYLNGPLIRLWDFNDPNAPQCTTNRALGLNVGLNCNFSVDSCASHFYQDRQCYSASLWIKDTLNGCEDSAFTTIYHSFLGPYNDEISHIRSSNPVYCEYEEVVLSVENEDCDWEPLAIYLDSANPSLSWEAWKQRYTYNGNLPVDSNGWVSLGVVRQFGSPGRYSGKKGEIYTTDDNVNCIDTIWLHKFYRIIPNPIVKPVILTQENCLPAKVVIKLDEDPGIEVYTYRIIWGDGNETSDTLPQYNLPDSFVHFYETATKNNIRFVVQSDSGCAGQGFTSIQIGYSASFDYYKGFHTESLDPKDRSRVICPLDTITFEDSIFYAGTFTSRWRENGVPETVEWQFGDGSPSQFGAFPIQHIYSAPGNYEVLMIATDSLNCKDTIKKTIKIPEVKAGIQFPKDEIKCAAITQLFDSSQIEFNYPFDSISKHLWNFGDGGALSFLKNPFRNYSSPGTYILTHIVENTYGCKDTAVREIKVSGPSPYFEILSDTVACPNHLVLFDNMSQDASNYIWNFGQTANNILSTNRDTSVSYRYLNPGIYNIYLTAIDSVFDPFTGRYNFCSAVFPDTSSAGQVLRRVRIVPKRAVEFNIPDTVCANIDFVLEDLSDPIYTQYDWTILETSELIQSSTQQKSWSLDSAGRYTFRYTPSYIPSSPFEPACPDTLEKRIQVVGFSTGFTYTFEQECGRYVFRDTSDATVNSYQWTFGQPSSGTKNQAQTKIAEHTYGGDTGSFEVCLVVESKFGCKDTICQTVTNTFLLELLMYNAFTPNGDGYNDVYDIEITNEIDYQLSIFNRNGTLVYYGSTDGTANDGNNWNGKLRNTGPDCTEGTYYYHFEYRFKCSDSPEKLRLNGVITLFR